MRRPAFGQMSGCNTTYLEQQFTPESWAEIIIVNEID